MTRAEGVADVCRKIVGKCVNNIAGKKYLKVEGWQAIASTFGYFAGAGETERVYQGEDLIGWKANGYIRDKAGVIVGTGEGFVGKDEKKWGSADEYACRAMAQTRAISRAARSVFSFVVVMIDENLSTTPAEEVGNEGFDHPQQQSTPAGTMQEELAKVGEIKVWEDVVVHFGKNKGKRLGDLKPKTLEWYQTDWKPEPFRGAWNKTDVQLYKAVQMSKGGDELDMKPVDGKTIEQDKQEEF